MILQFCCSIYFRTKETVHRYKINSLPKLETWTTAYLIDRLKRNSLKRSLSSQTIVFGDSTILRVFLRELEHTVILCLWGVVFRCCCCCFICWHCFPVFCSTSIIRATVLTHSNRYLHPLILFITAKRPRPPSWLTLNYCQGFIKYYFAKYTWTMCSCTKSQGVNETCQVRHSLGHVMWFWPFEPIIKATFNKHDCPFPDFLDLSFLFSVAIPSRELTEPAVARKAAWTRDVSSPYIKYSWLTQYGFAVRDTWITVTNKTKHTLSQISGIGRLQSQRETRLN